MKSSLLLLFSLCLLICADSVAQEPRWIKNVGGAVADGGLGIAVDTSANVYFTGYLNSTSVSFGGGAYTHTQKGGNDIFVCKYDSSGNYIWAKTWGGKQADRGLSLTADRRGHVYVTGHFRDTIEFNPGSATNRLVSKGGDDIYILKLSASDGSVIWAKSVGGSGVDQGLEVVVDDAGNPYVTGYFNSTVDFDPGPDSVGMVSRGLADIFVLKLKAADGSLGWVKSIGGKYNDWGRGIAFDAHSNSIYITGDFADTVDFDPGPDSVGLVSEGPHVKVGQITHIPTDIFVLKLDTTGAFVWAKQMGGNAIDIGRSIAVDASGNVYTTGSFTDTADFDPGPGRATFIAARPQATSLQSNRNFFISKLDGNGNYSWALGVGAMNHENVSRIAVEPSGQVYVTGNWMGTGTNGIDFNPGDPNNPMVWESNGSSDMFIAKYYNGICAWAKNIGGTSTDGGEGIVTDGAGNVYVVGGVTGPNPIEFDPVPGSGTPPGPFAITPNGGDAFIYKIGQNCIDRVTVTRSACDSFVYNDTVYKESGTYTHKFTNAFYCDSIVTLDLTVSQTVHNPVVYGHYCDSAVINGTAYYQSGVYTQLYSTAANCDSNITYDITVGKSTPGVTSITHTVCDSLVLNDTLVYKTTGMHIVTLSNASGCDSVIALNLTVHPTPVAYITANGYDLTAGNPGTYQWLNCDNNTIIPGATSQNYTATEDGWYAVIITGNNCSDTSDCVPVGKAYIREPGIDNSSVRVYPNPTDGRITIQTDVVLYQATIRLTNLLGQSLTEKTGQHGTTFTVDMTSYVPGVYFVEVTEGKETVRLKVVKRE